MACEFTQHRDAFRRILIVIRDEYAPPYGSRQRGISHERRRGWMSWGERQTHDEFAAVTQTAAARLDGSPVQFGEALDQRQSDSETTIGSTGHALDLGEHLKNSRDRLRSDSDAIVLDRQQ